MADKNFPQDYAEKTTFATNDYSLIADSEDSNKLKKIKKATMKGDTGATPISVEFVGDDMVFTKDDSNTVTLTGAKTDLKGDKGDTGNTGATGAQPNAVVFDGNDMKFTNTDATTFSLANAKVTLKGDKGDKGDTGAQGPQGEQGIQGIQGPAGTNGTNGTDGEDGISFTPKGAYSAGTAYVPNDVVSYLGSSWIALQNTTGNTPSEGAYWTLNAAKGTDGTGSGDVIASGTLTADKIILGDGTTNVKASTKSLSDFIESNAAITGATKTKITYDAKGLVTSGADMDGTEIVLTDVTTNNASTSKHGREPKATAPAAGNLNVEGIANGETSRSDKLLLDATSPSTQAYGDSASAGTSLKAARVDHKHAMPESTKDTTAVTGILKGNGTSISAAAASDITGQLITGFSSGAGTVAGTDTILQAINKLDGNIGTKQATMSKATGAEVDTGTDDAKYVTAKAIADSKLSYTDGTETLTNKRINQRVVSAASYTTDTGTSLTVTDCDMFIVTAQAGALKFNNPGGTPTQGQKLMIRIKDNGTARALTYDTQFRAMGVALPTTTVLSKTLYMGFIYNDTDTKRDLVAVGQEA